MTLIDTAVITIFAREFMEGAVIIGQYRTVIQRSDLPDNNDNDNNDDKVVVKEETTAPPNDDDDEAAAAATVKEEGEEASATPKKKSDSPVTKQQLLRAVTCSAFWAAVVAVLVVLAVAVPLGILSRGFDERVAEIIEGVSKVVAAICILLLTLKVPKWLGFYKSYNKKKGTIESGMDMTVRSVRFNVAWNVWREMAECGIFLLPALLSGQNLGAIPLSAVIGIVIGLAIGIGLYVASQRLNDTLFVAILVTVVLIFLSAGLVVGGVHEFEEVWGETNIVYDNENPNASSSNLPMVIFKPFGYANERTVLTITVFWLWLTLAACLHGYMMWRTRKINRELATAQAEAADVALKRVDELTLHESAGKESDSEETPTTDEVPLRDVGKTTVMLTGSFEPL